MTQRLVPAIDIIYEHNNRTWIRGENVLRTGSQLWSPDANFGFPPSDSIKLAPALEWSLTAQLGVVFGVAATLAGRNTSATVTSVIAINYVH